MDINIDSNLLERIKINNNELATYLGDWGFGVSYKQRTLTTERIPTKFLVIIGKEWRAEFDKQKKPTEGHNNHHYNQQLERLEHYEKEVLALTKKIKNKPKSLIQLASKLKAVFEEELGERYWLYYYNPKSDTYTPYTIKELRYYAIDNHNDYAHIKVHTVINSKHSTNNGHFSIDMDDFRENAKDPYEILKSKGYFFETPALYKQYRADEKDYNEKALWQNLQVLSDGKKYINDNVFHSKENYSMHRRVCSTFDSNAELTEVPTEFIIYAYDLEKHTHTWLNTRSVELYKYNPNISEKLILPEEHKDLINILLSDDIQEIGGDIIENKGRGTLILTKGKAGLGKTVTSEIYSEKKELPLYSVHSGQLGTNGDQIETKLREIFKNTERWGCILLIDEADVYIRTRDNDVNHNAIVATFLRTMEYYSGILFMTTNRVDDVDEAIESRCTAILKYDMPSKDMANQLWNLFIKQYQLKIKKGTVEELVEKMGEMSGRDIKNITLLVSKYSQGKDIKIVDFETFKICATFRGKYAIGADH